MKSTEQITKDLNQLSKRRDVLMSKFVDFKKAINAVTAKNFQVPGIALKETTDTTLDVDFNGCQFRLIFGDNVKTGRGEIKAYMLNNEGNLVPQHFFEFTFDGQGVTDIQKAPNADSYNLANDVHAIEIILNVVSKAL